MQEKTTSLVFLLAAILFAGCNRSMSGIEDGLTVIGIIIALMVGAYYLIKKIWINVRRSDWEDKE